MWSKYLDWIEEGWNTETPKGVARFIIFAVLPFIGLIGLAIASFMHFPLFALVLGVMALILIAIWAATPLEKEGS